ncbi:MAG TPA: serine hydrolase [Terriglobales bacterium]|nr:serine hydrolase [Terriglobales bacterium]
MKRFCWVLQICGLATFIAIAASAHSQSAPAAQKPAQNLAWLDQFVPAEMQKWKVPGLAIAVVRHDQVIYSRGFGMRDVRRNLPVTTKTLFAIGSISKSFTALSMGILNDEGKFDWDKPVRQYIPDFQVYDPVASERMTPRDLITHRSGLASHDLVWYSSNFSREDLVHRLRFLQSNRDFRSGYHYNNMLVMTAGYVVGKVSGEGWENFVRQHIWEPLGMTGSNFSVDDSQKSADFAQPYRKDESSGEVNQVPFHEMVAIGPAGSINSNIEDMSRYAMFQLGKGKVGGRQVVSEANLNLMHSPQVSMGAQREFKELGSMSYGMGWVNTSYRGHRMVWHNGEIDGFYALLSMLPDDDLGVVILTNIQDWPVTDVAAYQIYDRLLGLDVIDWSGRFEQAENKSKAADAEAKKTEASNRKLGTHPSHDLKDYVGRFENPGYGTLTIQPASDGFTASLNQITVPFQPYHYDVFQVPENAHWILGKTKIRFLTNMDGDIESIAAPLEPNAPEIVFTRVGEKLPREVLLPLAGDYVVADTVITVALAGEELQLTVPGEPVYTLAPQKDLRFTIKGRSGYSVEFHKDNTGQVSEMVFFQPEGTFVAKRKTAP